MPLGLGFGELVLVMMVGVFPLVAVWRIVGKAGYPGVLALLVFIPLVNLIALYVFAFSEWPLERRAGGRLS
jgi:hypothetical protein